MATINSLAQEFGCTAYGLQEFAGDVLDGRGQSDELSSEDETIIREGWAMALEIDRRHDLGAIES